MIEHRVTHVAGPMATQAGEPGEAAIQQLGLGSGIERCVERLPISKRLHIAALVAGKGRPQGHAHGRITERYDAFSIIPVEDEAATPQKLRKGLDERDRP